MVLPQFCFHSQVHFFHTHVPLVSLPIMRRVTCSRSGRRRCAWTWLPQRNVIHDTFNLLNGDAGFGLALSPVLARHTLSLFGWTCFDVLSQPRGYYDAFAAAQAGCSASSTPGRHCPGRSRPRSSVPSTTPLRCWTTTQFGYHRCRSWEWEQAHKTRGSFRPSFLVFQSVTPGWTVAVHCCAATAQRGHHCCRLGRRLLRLGCCAGRPSPLKVSCRVARKTHATFSPSLRCASFVIEAVCSMACSVLARFTMFWIFFSQIPGAVSFSLFHCKAMTLLAVPHSLLECAHFPSPEVHLACSCAAQVFFLSRSCSTSLNSACLQRRSSLPIIETQKSPWSVSDRFVSRKNNEVTVWIMKILFFHPLHLQKVFPNCLPCATRWTASSASALLRQLNLD